MSQLFGSNDPWENGWTNNEEENTSSFPGLGSTYLTSSQLLNNDNRQSSSDIVKEDIDNVPESYKKVYMKIGKELSSANDLESKLLSRLVVNDNLTNYQKSKLLDIIYDHNLLPPSIENNFYQILGLISLELSMPGSGDFVTLQFKINNLPDLPESVVDLLNKSVIFDPLGAQLANTSISDDKLPSWKQPDPILVDHSKITLNDDQDLKPTKLKHIQEMKIDKSSINKYINDIRDKFHPLVGSEDVITIKEIPEKEGLLFKHVNYIITHDIKFGVNNPSGIKKVIRRYSDFVWYVFINVQHLLFFFLLLTLQVA